MFGYMKQQAPKGVKSVTGSSFENALDVVPKRHVLGCNGLVRAERLSGGASQETYRLTVITASGEKLLGYEASTGWSGP